MQLANRLSPGTWDFWRITFALAAKDIVDALKNKTTLTMIVGLSMVMLTVEALPLLLKLDNRPRLAIYDADRSGAADELRRDGVVQVAELRKEADAVVAARETSSQMIAVVLPEGWQDGSGPLTIEGYIGHWVGQEKADQIAQEAARSLTAVTGRPITIETQTVYPTMENGGHSIMVSLGLTLATLLITTILVPYLILEEKTTHTLDVLRVSPASVTQVLLGKGLAGTVYGLLAAAVLLGFNLSLVNFWGLMIPTIVAIVLFGVGLGLLVGILVENEGGVQMWIALLVIVLMAPLLFVFTNNSILPDWIQQILNWLPTTAAFDLMRLSFGNILTAADVWPRLAVILLAVVLVFGAAGWRLRAWEH